MAVVFPAAVVVGRNSRSNAVGGGNKLGGIRSTSGGCLVSESGSKLSAEAAAECAKRGSRGCREADRSGADRESKGSNESL